MFFRIERTGPPDGGPARSDPPFPLSASLTHPARADSDRLSDVFHQRSWSRYYYRARRKPASLLPSHQDRLILVDAHPRRPLVGRIPARHAHTRHAPSGAGASRRPLGQTLRLSPSPFLTLGLERGMHFAAPAALVLATPPSTPTQAYGTHCPPLAAMRPATPSAQAPGASGTTPSALSASGASVSRPISRVQCRVAFPSPPFRFCTLFSALPVACHFDYSG